MKHYFAVSTRLAVRTDGTLRFLLGDHIGSSSITTNASGAKTASALYREASCKDKAFGETRFTAGTLSTDYKFTGQREESALGIYWFSSRWFDPTLGRFMSPDTIVPTSTQGTQAWDRYAFVNNNPVRYTDPTGHEAKEDPCDYYGYGTEQCPQSAPLTSTVSVNDVAGIVKSVDDEILAIENSQQEAAFWIGLGIGIAFSAITCATFLCGAGLTTVSAIATTVASEILFSSDDTQEKLDQVANSLVAASQNATGDSIYISMSFQPETAGSMVRFDENTRYLEMDSSYHGNQYVYK